MWAKHSMSVNSTKLQWEIKTPSEAKFHFIQGRRYIMDIDALIARINELYKKSKEVGLTEEEKEEQSKLRRRYIDSVKSNFRAQLETVKPNKPTNKYRN